MASAAVLKPQAAMPASSATGVLALLEEEDDNLKLYALQQLDRTVDEFWFQISGSIALIEALYEDEDFKHRELAALVASKVFYHLDDLDDALTYALGAGGLFDVNGTSEYVQTILARCVDRYIEQRVKAAEQNHEADEIDPRLTAIVERLFDRCFNDGQYEQAVGIALESRRLDRLEGAITSSSDTVKTLTYALNVTQTLIVSRSFRDQVLRLIIKMYEAVPSPDYAAICECLTFLGDADEVAKILFTLLSGSEDDTRLAYQIGFNLFEAEMQSFMIKVKAALDQAVPQPAPVAADGDTAMEETTAPTVEDTSSIGGRYKLFKSIIAGDVPIELERQFLATHNHADLQILKKFKAGVEVRNSVCHGATVFANAMMHCGTTVDTFLRENLDWLAKATNWAKFSATAGLGVIHRGNLAASRTLLSPYLPSQPGGSNNSAYSEGGGLYALGLIHTNHGSDVSQFLLDSLKATQHEVIQHGACLGLGIAGLGTEDEDAFEEVKNVLYMDNAVAGEAAGLALGLLYAGSGTDKSAEMLAYAHDTQHEKIIRGLAIGLALIQYGREEEAETTIEQMTRDQDPIIRYGGMFVIGLAYRGTSNNAAIQKLLHFAVSDVADDVRRAAVMNLGFVMINAPEQCPRIVSLLAESYNPHVRYGAAMAVGIAAAGTGLKDAVTLLEPMLTDSVDFVQQGALLSLAMVQIEQPESKTKVLRERIEKLHSNRGAEIMTRQGAIMAAGILDAGGRNVTIGLASRTGYFRRTAIVGLTLFLQHWYWYPLSHCLGLALQPTALIAVDSQLRAPKDFRVLSNCKPSLFAYPAPVPVEDKKSKDKLPTAVLSTTARAKARAAKKEAGKTDGDAMETDKPEDATEEGAEGAEAAGKEKEKPKEEEPTSFTVENPARVAPQQRQFITIPTDQRFIPIRPAKSGFVVVYDTTPDAGDAEFLYQPETQQAEQEQEAAAPSAADAGDAPPAPEPFEYVPS